MANVKKIAGEIVRLPHAKHGAHSIPMPIRYPSDYALAGAVSALLRDYGRIGTINRLVEAARNIESRADPMVIIRATRRVEVNES